MMTSLIGRHFHANPTGAVFDYSLHACMLNVASTEIMNYMRNATCNSTNETPSSTTASINFAMAHLQSQLMNPEYKAAEGAKALWSLSSLDQ